MGGWTRSPRPDPPEVRRAPVLPGWTPLPLLPPWRAATCTPPSIGPLSQAGHVRFAPYVRRFIHRGLTLGFAWLPGSLGRGLALEPPGPPRLHCVRRYDSTDRSAGRTQRARRDHGLWPGRLGVGRPARGAGSYGLRHRQARDRVPDAALRLQGQQGPRLRLRRGRAAPGRDRAGGSVRGGVQRRQLQHRRRPAGQGEVRGADGGRPHLRPPPRRDLPAPRHPHRGDREMDHRPGDALPDPRRDRLRLEGPERGDLPGHGGPAHLMGGLDGRAARVQRPPPGGGRQPHRPGPHPHGQHDPSGGRPGVPGRQPGGPGRAAAHGDRGAPPPGRPAGRAGGALVRVAIAGAGNVGQFIAADLLAAGHQVTLIEKDPAVVEAARGTLQGAEWFPFDACEVLSLVVARVNNPKNHGLFSEAWGVDVAVSTPHILRSLVEEAVTVGSMVRLMQFEQGQVSLHEVTLAEGSPSIGRTLRDLALPVDAAVVAVVREGHVVVPREDTVFAVGDEVLAVTSAESEDYVRKVLVGETRPRDQGEEPAGPGTSAEEGLRMRGGAGASPQTPPRG